MFRPVQQFMFEPGLSSLLPELNFHPAEFRPADTSLIQTLTRQAGIRRR